MAWIGWMLAIMGAPAVAHAAPPPPSAAIDRELDREGRQELIAGINLGVAGTAGFVAGLSVYGQHSLGPRVCLVSEQARCERDAERHDRIALAGQIIAISSIALMVAGAALTAVGATNRHRARNLALRPGGLSLRF